MKKHPVICQFFHKHAKKYLKNTPIKVVSVIGYPLGETLPEVKQVEAMLAKNDGADELDVVASVSSIVMGDYEYLYNEIMQIVDDTKLPIKVILETGMLNNEQISEASRVLKKAGASFVETSTEYHSVGATMEAIRTIIDSVGDDFGVKASGGIKDVDSVLNMISCGADRIGTSSAVEIIKNFK